MAEIAWRRAGELGNFVLVLEFGAVNLHHRVRVAEQRLGGGLNRPRLARSGRSSVTGKRTRKARSRPQRSS
jgi:hypothetical protein